jgi:nitric oxide dioxygenase
MGQDYRSPRENPAKRDVMTPAQIKLIKQSWAQFEPSKMLSFYDRLFSLRPDLRPLFRGSIESQEAKLINMLSSVVDYLDNLQSLIPAVRDLGRRHVGYGARPEDYKDVCDALLITLSEGLGPAWTREVNRAWTDAYDLLAGAMIDAAREAASRKTTPDMVRAYRAHLDADVA